jgi:DNA-binding response OmpR family regulator
MKILIIEDEEPLAESIEAYLVKHAFVCDVVKTVSDADYHINLYRYDCAIVDLTLPDGQGLDLVKTLKEVAPKTGILILSARNSLDDKVDGLEYGADDYITKPFHFSELKARINAVIRRRHFGGQRHIVFNEITIAPEKRRVYIADQQLDLTRKEYELLVHFVANQDQVLTKESIAEHLWGSQSDLVDSFDFIYSHIKNLRKKIEKAGGNDYLETVYGIGYRYGGK